LQVWKCVRQGARLLAWMPMETGINE